MNFMSIMSAIVTFIRYIPELIKIYREIAGLIEEAKDTKEATKKAGEIAEAIKKARATKDTSDLEDMFRPKNFDIKIVQKKSLDLGNLQLWASILDQKKITEEVEQFLAKEEPKNPLKEIEKLVLAQELNEIPASEETPKVEEPIAPPKKSLFGFSFMSRSSAIIGGSYISNVRMTGGGRMGSSFFMILILITAFGCKKTVRNQPDFTPRLYAGDSEQGGVYRKQSGEFILATDPKMDDMVALSYKDLSCVYQTYVQNCQAYRKKVVKCKDLSAEAEGLVK